MKVVRGMHTRSYAFETSRPPASARSAAAPTTWSARRATRRAATIYDRHGAVMYSFARSLTQDPRHAQTLVVEAIGSRPGNRTIRELTAAVYVTWSCRPEPAGLRQDSETQTPLHRLPDEHRAALALCTVGNHTYRQAAELLELPPGEVADLLHEAMLALSGSRRGPVTG